MNSEPDVVGAWLETHRAELLAAWRGLVLAHLSPSAAPSLATPDPFANPVGSRVQASTAAMLDALIERRSSKDVASAMEPLMRVEAIQGRPASEAVAFVLLLGRASREIGAEVPPELAAGLEARLDALLLVAFDLYTRCREDICEIRVRAAHRRVSALLDRLSVAEEEASS